MVKMTTLTDQVLFGGPVQAGVDVEVTERDAEILEKLGRAKRKDLGTLHVKRSYKRRDMRAED